MGGIFLSLDQILELTWAFQFEVGGIQAPAALAHRSEDATSYSFLLIKTQNE